MASADRLQLNRALLDNWSTREQLCLASAVSCSGDQNWMSVSRNLKLICSNDNRPADWFSLKSCALQYENLLENVETPKRKKRTNENNGSSSPAATVETPTDSILRRLTEERMQELKTDIRKGQEEYAKIHAELQKMQAPHLTEEILQQMWHDIEREQDAQRIAEMKMENQLREREQRRQELQRNWRLGGGTSGGGLTLIAKQQQQENNVVIDMDVEEIIGVNKSTPPVQQSLATSPLLSSLLKSPTATAPPQIISASSSARTNAPTITTLLTSGSIPNTNQPAIILNSNIIPPEEAVQLLTRPISCAPTDALNITNAASIQHLLSPSQSAPTLSMLLERNKAGASSQTTISDSSTSKIPLTPSMESNKELLPMEIEEDTRTNKQDDNVETAVDSDEPDPNEEQQLLEVFKNIGNMDELDIDVAAVIDEEVDFLKSVDEETANEAVVNVDEDNPENSTGRIKKQDAAKTETKEFNQVKTVSGSEGKTETTTERKVRKIETSSDDSNDNIPLAAVATLENKERSLPSSIAESEEKSNEKSFLSQTNQRSNRSTPISRDTISPAKGECTDDAQHKEDHMEIIEEDEASIKIERLESDPENDDNDEGEIKGELATEQEIKHTTETLDTENESTTATEKSLLNAEENSKSGETQGDAEKSNNAIFEENLNLSAQAIETLNSNESEINTPTTQPQASNQSIADTDEDSNNTDVSITTLRREEKAITSRLSAERTPHTRKAGSHDTSTSKSTEDSDSSSANRTLKRTMLNIISNLLVSKSAQTLQRALNDDQLKSRYQRICYRRSDFHTIKKNIENGTIRNMVDLQRDLLQIIQNIYFLFHATSTTYKAAESFKNEVQNVREFISNSKDFEMKTEKDSSKEIKQAPSKQARTGSRKSQRIS